VKAVVVGLGQFGAEAARALERSGVDTIAIDSDKAVVERIKDDVTLAVCTDGTFKQNLEEHGVGGADLLLAGIGEDFEAQILVVVLAKQVGVKRVIARGASDVHARVLRAVGADEVIHPEREAAHATVLRALIPAGGAPVNLSKGLYATEVAAPERIAGRTVTDLTKRLLEERVTIFAIRREGEDGASETMLAPDVEIQEGDALLLAGSESDLARTVTGLTQKPAE